MADERHRKAARRLAKKAMDINQFLVTTAGLEPPADQTDGKHVVTYHDPCHLKKSLKVFDEPRVVIQAAPGYRLTEMAQPDWCCGMGGSFNLEHYDISKGIGQKKAAQIKSHRSRYPGHGVSGMHDSDLRHALPGRYIDCRPASH